MDDATIDGERMWSALTQSLLTLFDRSVRGVTARSLSEVDERFPEVEITSTADALAPTGAVERELAAVT